MGCWLWFVCWESLRSSHQQPVSMLLSFWALQSNVMFIGVLRSGMWSWSRDPGTVRWPSRLCDPPHKPLKQLKPETLALEALQKFPTPWEPVCPSGGLANRPEIVWPLLWSANGNFQLPPLPLPLTSLLVMVWQLVKGWGQNKVRGMFLNMNDYAHHLPFSRGMWGWERGSQTLGTNKPADVVFLFFSILFVGFLIIKVKKKKIKTTGIIFNANGYLIQSSYCVPDT